MTAKVNDFEHYTVNNTNVTTANSATASNAAIDTVSPGSPGTIRAVNTRSAHGSWSLEFVPAPELLNFILMNDGGTGTEFTNSNAYYFTGYPSSETIFDDYQGAAGGTACRLHMQTDGRLKMVNSQGAAMTGGLMTNPVPLNTWIEIHVFGSMNATTGTMSLKVYPLNSATPIDSKTVINQNTMNASGTVGRRIIGKFTNAGSMAPFYMDDHRQNLQSSTEYAVIIPTNVGPSVSFTTGTPATAVQNGVVPLRGTATDSDGTVVSSMFTVVSFPSTLSAAPAINNAGSLTTANFVPLVAGAYVIRLSAIDNSGATSFVDKTITVSLASGSSVATELVFDGTLWR